MFKATNKAEAGRKLALLNEEIARQFPLFNSLRVIPILLCIEDVINTVEINFEGERKIGTRFVKDENYLVMVYFVNEWYEMLNFMMVEISDRGFYDSYAPRYAFSRSLSLFDSLVIIALLPKKEVYAV